MATSVEDSVHPQSHSHCVVLTATTVFHYHHHTAIKVTEFQLLLNIYNFSCIHKPQFMYNTLDADTYSYLVMCKFHLHNLL
jgi:hypothetical protein